MSASIRQLVASCCIGMGFVIASYLLFHHILLKILGLEKAEKTGFIVISSLLCCF